MDLLTEPQITGELATVPAWTRDGAAITTVTQRKDFRDALLYLGAVAYLAAHFDADIAAFHGLRRRRARPAVLTEP